MEKLKLKHFKSDKGNARDIYYGPGTNRYYTRQESPTKNYVQWFTATKYSDGYTAGYEQEYPLKKDLLIITPEGIEKTMTDGIAQKEYKFSWEEKTNDKPDTR